MLRADDNEIQGAWFKATCDHADCEATLEKTDEAGSVIYKTCTECGQQYTLY